MNTQDWSPLGWTGWISLHQGSQQSPLTASSLLSPLLFHWWAKQTLFSLSLSHGSSPWFVTFCTNTCNPASQCAQSQRPSKGKRHFKQRSPALWELLTVTERRNKLHNSLLSHIALFITAWLNWTRKWAEFQKRPFWFRKRHRKFRRQECGKNTVSPMNTHQKDSAVEGHIWRAPLCCKHLLAWGAETTQRNVRFMGLSTEGRTGVSPSALGVLAFRPSPACVYRASLYLLMSSFLF